jgi:hypothetical protein
MARPPRSRREAGAALVTAHARAMRAAHRLGRPGPRRERPAVTGQPPPGRGRARQVRRPHPGCLGARVVAHGTPKRRSAQRSRRAPEVLPALGRARPPRHHPLGGGLRGRGGQRPAWVEAGPGTPARPSAGATPPAWRGGQDVAPGRHRPGHPGHQAWPARRAQGGHAAPGGDPAAGGGWPGRSRWKARRGRSAARRALGAARRRSRTRGQRT